MAKQRTWYATATLILDEWRPRLPEPGIQNFVEVAAFRLHDVVGVVDELGIGDEYGFVIRRGNSQFEFRNAPDHMYTYEREFYLAPYQGKYSRRESWVVVKEGCRFTALSGVEKLDLFLEREILSGNDLYVQPGATKTGKKS